MNDINLFQPIYGKIGEPAISTQEYTYYEIRYWVHHILCGMIQFKSLKAAKKYYKKNYKINEEMGLCYIEIIHVKPLNK